MKKTTMFGLAGALLAGLGTVAQAQTAATDAGTKPISIKLGVFLPTNSDVKDAVGKSWFSAGAEYAFVPSGEGASTSNLVPLVYLDYAGKNNNRTFADTDASGNPVNDTLSLKASYVGLGAGIRGSSPQAGSSITPYYGAGVGVYFLNATAAVKQGTTTVSDSQNKTSIGFKVNGGVEFSGSYFVEAAYTV
ncbi:MAG: hypothetical protein M3Y13_08150, partial [Armatimonadota bacterium]|nr:hypothetical protein [Armatimonadota bacterium]